MRTVSLSVIKARLQSDKTRLYLYRTVLASVLARGVLAEAKPLGHNVTFCSTISIVKPGIRHAMAGSLADSLTRADSVLSMILLLYTYVAMGYH